MKGLWTIVLLLLSNVFMTLAWYGHLRFKDFAWGKSLGLFSIILISWGMAFFEYVLQVPANRLGHLSQGGPFSLVQLKVIQEVITLAVFVVFSLVAFKEEALRWNHALAALRDGRCAAFLYGDTQIVSLLRDPLYRDRYEMPLPPINLTPWAVVIHPDDRGSNLEAAVSAAIVDWYRGGLLTRLEDHWGIPVPDFTRQREALWQRRENGRYYCGEGVGPETPAECL